MLAQLIDRLLNGDSEALGLIFNYQIEKISSYQDDITALSEKIDEVSNLEVKTKKELLEKMERLINVAKINNNQKTTGEYYLKLLDLFRLELVDVISLESISRIINFLEDESLVKVLKDKNIVVKKKINN